MNPIFIIHIVISIILITVIMLQPKNAGFNANASQNSFSHSRRGFEKFLFQVTIVVTILFVATSLAGLLLA
jgi:preprotein translocase subunit SecG